MSESRKLNKIGGWVGGPPSPSGGCVGHAGGCVGAHTRAKTPRNCARGEEEKDWLRYIRVPPAGPNRPLKFNASPPPAVASCSAGSENPAPHEEQGSGFRGPRTPTELRKNCLPERVGL
jgi:hypothetical protein